MFSGTSDEQSNRTILKSARFTGLPDLIAAICRFQKFIVCGVFYILYWCYRLKCGQNGPKSNILGPYHQYSTLKSNNFEKLDI